LGSDWKYGQTKLGQANKLWHSFGWHPNQGHISKNFAQDLSRFWHGKVWSPTNQAKTQTTEKIVLLILDLQ
jgi:hypothetical protein